jgi:hypothetical protein
MTMQHNPRKERSDAKILRPLTPEEIRSIRGGEALLAFPFIQQAMTAPGSGSNG